VKVMRVPAGEFARNFDETVDAIMRTAASLIDE